VLVRALAAGEGHSMRDDSHHGHDPMNVRVRGALAAAVTPLRGGGDELDLHAIASLVDFYSSAGLDGLLILGTTGEGVLLSPDERRAVAEEFLACSRNRLPIVVHCGAQSTRDTAALAEHAALLGAAGVAVISPPYYALDAAAILSHLATAAAACAPTRFYIYEFAARSGYAVPLSVVDELRAQAPNFVGLKVSDSPYESVQPYLIAGLDVFIGFEELIHEGLRAGAAGAVSGLAAALPELTIDAVRTGSADDSTRAGRVRAAIQRFPFQAALKLILQRRGVAVDAAVRTPLRGLDPTEVKQLGHYLNDPGADVAALFRARPSPP
jgi:dihydrodipicolinate synthase/N-acetylneuraminate lyase